MSKKIKKLVISGHAEKRMRQRRVSHNQICVAIRSPTRTLAGSATYTQRLEKDHPNGKCLVAIIEDCGEEIKLVSAFWSKG